MRVAEKPFGLLTTEQRAVVDLPVETRALVTAGPGAGKTHTLVRRLEMLVDDGEATAGDLLVLTFSRAAVRELRARLARHGQAARYVRVHTFDAWALELLTTVRGEVDWRIQPFDARIRAAAAAIQIGEADDFCEELGHVAIDEFQDLVGERRVMVESLLDRFDCGFTVVGDPAQAIYGFQIRNLVERAAENGRFAAWLREIFADELVELALTENFRVRYPEAEGALSFGTRLRSNGGDGKMLRRGLHSMLRGTMPLESLSGQFERAMLSAEGVTTAVLCRTNGHALLVSEELHDAGIRHRLQRSAVDQVVPAWIGRLMSTVRSTTITRAEFDRRLPELPFGSDDDPELLWDWLVRATAAGRGTRAVDLSILRVRMAGGMLPDELVEQPSTNLVVSSYHRAKGLEFDRVIVADPGMGREESDAESADEARMLFVALTRARDDVAWIETPAYPNGRVCKDTVSTRWVKVGWDRRQRHGMEIRGDDVSGDDPPGTVDFTADCPDLQVYLMNKVRPGDEVVLERLHDLPLGDKESPPYLVLHHGRAIATTSRRFRLDIRRFLQTGAYGGEPTWPRRLERVRVDAIEAVCGSEATGVEAGLGPHGVWLVPKLVGLSSFVYGGHSSLGDL
ncbi:UvrD-helicase domain-containing protein [Crossiella cryophila]|uniref:UvrD-like helicase ATP-binding domain-containing protein n=1 Tax=Crossiella cryophila TaxID=43355 RepID=A0A7W7FRW7_9PSEU|nr:UvrD-helicase domain-containing protein [Crossiella cryophila]MBB4676461.1 hypothetical protein [Crossiella cryophila]